MKRKPATTATAERREIVKSFRRKAAEFQKAADASEDLYGITFLNHRAADYRAFADQIERGEF